LIETALYIVGVGICVVVILVVLGAALQIISGACEIIWEIIDPNGPVRGKKL
jgi:hypothetical protein